MPRTNPARYSDPIRGTRTVQEAGRLIGCGDTKVHELIRNGSLQAVQVGNRNLPTTASLEHLLGRPLADLEAPLRQEPPPSAEPKGPAKTRAKEARRPARGAAGKPQRHVREVSAVL